MMLASKVWDDESYENPEFAQLCPLYSIDEINTFERVFLKSVGYNMAVKGSEYAKTYFLLRTLGAKDNPDFGMQPLDQMRASRLAERCLQKQIEFRERYADDTGHDMNWTICPPVSEPLKGGLSGRAIGTSTDIARLPLRQRHNVLTCTITYQKKLGHCSMLCLYLPTWPAGYCRLSVPNFSVGT
eukprot:1597427-Amphidinium_carterae.1